MCFFYNFWDFCIIFLNFLKNLRFFDIFINGNLNNISVLFTPLCGCYKKIKLALKFFHRAVSGIVRFFVVIGKKKKAVSHIFDCLICIKHLNILGKNFKSFTGFFVFIQFFMKIFFNTFIKILLFKYLNKSLRLF